MAAGQELTARQQREREYYNEFARGRKSITVDFEPVSGTERRPWNSYWWCYEVGRLLYRGPEQRLLDFGCGRGESAVCYASVGYEVWGFDIAEGNIAQSEQTAQEHGFADRTHFSVQTAETLDYPDDYFDVIVGIDILHHIEIEPALRQCHRILKPGGVAIFREHAEVPGLDWLRNTALVRRFFPNEVSLDQEHEITEDERKLTPADLRVIRGIFPKLELRRFGLFSRLDAVASKLVPASMREDEGLVRFLEQLDFFVINAVPMTARFGGTVVLQATK